MLDARASAGVSSWSHGSISETFGSALHFKTFSRSRTKQRGHVAEWLRSGLQIRVPRFNSGRGLHFSS